MTTAEATPAGPVLEIKGLAGGIAGNEIIRGVDLTVGAGEVHVIMGPNGSGKSTLAHLLAGRPGYEVTGGTATIDGVDLLALPPHERALAGLFLVTQHASEVAGISLTEALELAARQPARPLLEPADVVARLGTEAQAVGLATDLLDRSLNVDASGGERKRAETCQLAVLQPSFAILDELDSGLDIDALAACARRIEAMTNDGVSGGLGVLAITHFPRLLEYLSPDRIYVLVDGQIVDSGGAELAATLEASGYAKYMPASEEPGVAVSIGGLGGPAPTDPILGDPIFGDAGLGDPDPGGPSLQELGLETPNLDAPNVGPPDTDGPEAKGAGNGTAQPSE